QGTSTAATNMLVTAKSTLISADKTMSSAQQVLTSLEPGSTTHYELDKLIEELTQAASSVKQLTDYLEQNPGSLLHGKNQD
ncbi:MAG: MCE family protein, partial [Methylobacter sp.]